MSHELHTREGDGIKVTLLHNFSTNKSAIHLVDVRDEIDTEFLVPNDQALDAFFHPFIYFNPATHEDSE